MSNTIPSRPRQFQQRRAVAIVASQYNEEFVSALVSHAQKELGALLPDGTVQVYHAPGAFEIPLIVQELAERATFSALIALGVIIKGDTDHARLIGEAVTRSLLDISLHFRIPVIHEVLLLENEEQARARCLGEELNRGTEAARVAVRAMLAVSETRK